LWYAAIAGYANTRGTGPLKQRLFVCSGRWWRCHLGRLGGRGRRRDGLEGVRRGIRCIKSYINKMKDEIVEVTLTISGASTTRHDALAGGGSCCQHCETKDCQHFGAPVFHVGLQEQRLICRRLARSTAAYSDALRRRIACESQMTVYSNQSVASNTSILGILNCSIWQELTSNCSASWLATLTEYIPRRLGIPGWLCQGSISMDYYQVVRRYVCSRGVWCRRCLNPL
jgi:hypothetical protein